MRLAPGGAVKFFVELPVVAGADEFDVVARIESAVVATRYTDGLLDAPAKDLQGGGRNGVYRYSGLLKIIARQTIQTLLDHGNAIISLLMPDPLVSVTATLGKTESTK